MAADVAVVKEKVQTYLRELAGGFEVDGEGDYSIRHGSTRVFVRVESMGERSVVSIWCILTSETPVSPELWEYIATEGGRYRFGSMSGWKRDDGTANVVFDHTLLGDFLDPEELKNAVAVIAGTSDDLDHEIAQRFGGKVFHEN